jgi:hypothetical protein
VLGVVDHVAAAGRRPKRAIRSIASIPAAEADHRRGLRARCRERRAANPADDHTLPVLDPNIRGKTDRVVLRFRKPRAADRRSAPRLSVPRAAGLLFALLAGCPSPRLALPALPASIRRATPRPCARRSKVRRRAPSRGA